MKRVTIVAVGCLLVMLAGTSVVVAEEIKLGGGGAPIDSIFKPVRDSFEQSSGHKLNLVFTNATIAFKQLYNNELEASTAGMSLEDLLATVKKDGFEVKDPTTFQAVTLSTSKIYIIVNKNNPVAKLSKEQLKGIFTGKIANWKDVGGIDAPVIVVSSSQNPATSGAFKKLALDNEPFTKEVIDAVRFEDVRTAVFSNPEAIGFGPVTLLDATVKCPETPEFARPITIITKGKPSPKVQQLIDYVLGDGKKFIKN